MSLESPTVERPNPISIPFFLYLTGGVAIFLFGSNTHTTYPTNRSAWYEWGATVVLFALVLVLRRSARFHRIWPVAFALFTASCANALNLFLGNWLARIFSAPGSYVERIAVDKLSQAIPVILTIILLTRLSGDSMGTIYLKKGNLRQGLTFGAISFTAFAVIFAALSALQANAPTAQGLFARGVSVNTIVSAIPWILVFIFANGMLEELWFRGVSLGRLIPLLGPGLSILVTSLVFGSLHLGATYITPAERLIFFAITFGLGLVNGYMMVKTRSIWGSVLFHAGYDLFVIIPLLASQ